MKNNFESNSNRNDGNDDNSEIHCSESEWRRILTRAKKETERFQNFYETLRVKPDEDRLDKCALAMGWQLSGPANADADDAAPEPELDFEPVPPPEPPLVYSLQNTPECIAVSALFRCANKRWAKMFSFPCGAGKLPARAGASLIKTLDNAERDMLLAIDAIDASEPNLSIALMKDAHESLNRHFAEMEVVPAVSGNRAYTKQLESVRAVIFDLREMCLRIIRDAHEELAGNEEN